MEYLGLSRCPTFLSIDRDSILIEVAFWESNITNRQILFFSK